VHPLRRQTAARPSVISHRSPNATGTPRGLRRAAAFRAVPETFLRRTGAPLAFGEVEAAGDEPAASRALLLRTEDGLEETFLLMEGSIPRIRAECNYGAKNFITRMHGDCRGRQGDHQSRRCDRQREGGKKWRSDAEEMLGAGRAEARRQRGVGKIPVQWLKKKVARSEWMAWRWR